MHNVPTPEFNIPDGGLYLWNWFHEISDGLRRIADGVCFPVPWSEYLAWSKVTDVIVYPFEYVILRTIDDAFCSEMNKEMQAYQERENERHKRDIEAARAASRS